MITLLHLAQPLVVGRSDVGDDCVLFGDVTALTSRPGKRLLVMMAGCWRLPLLPEVPTPALWIPLAILALIPAHAATKEEVSLVIFFHP